MEKVQFQLEATLPELKDLYEKRLFSKVSHNALSTGGICEGIMLMYL